MEKNCLYCGTHFTSQRASKKYCSDNCKQMAYFKRNGLILSGISEASNIKYEAPVITKTENLKHAIQNIVKDENQSLKKVIIKSDTITIDDKTLDAIISRLTIAMEQKLNQAIEKIEQDLNAKYKNLIVKSHFTENDKIDNSAKKTYCTAPFTGVVSAVKENKSKINYCNPCEIISVKYTSLTENTVSLNNKKQQEYFTLAEIKKSALKNTEIEKKEEQEEKAIEIAHSVLSLELADDESKEKEQEAENNTPNTEAIQILESEQKINKLNAELENKNSLAKEQEPEYKWVESEFIKSIEKNYLNNNEHLFKEPLRYWDINQAANVNWISVRLRCLVESMIKLSNYNKIDKHTLLCMTDAFNRLIKSNAFKNLPDKYPYVELIKELCIKLNRLVQKSEYSEQIKFSLSTEIKSRLISIRYEMLNYFPASKFSELDFTEEKNSLGKNEKNKSEDENEKKNIIKNDWRIRYEAMKRQQLRGAA